MKHSQYLAVAFASATILFASGCTERGEPPSLAKRPFETSSAALADVPAVRQPSNTARVSRLATSVEQARRGAAAFDDLLPKTQRIVAAALGGAVSSEAWIVAQLALSRLESLRDPVQTALADVDGERRLLISELASEDQDRLTSAQREIEAISNRQAETITALKSQLRTN